MSSSFKRIFCKFIPKRYLFELLEQTCYKNEIYYEIDMNSYRKMIYHGFDKIIKDDLINFYETEHQHFILRELTFLSFVTIVRQICRTAKLRFETKKFNGVEENKYKYYVYHQGVLTEDLNFTYWNFKKDKNNIIINGEITFPPEEEEEFVIKK